MSASRGSLPPDTSTESETPSPSLSELDRRRAPLLLGEVGESVAVPVDGRRVGRERIGSVRDLEEVGEAVAVLIEPGNPGQVLEEAQLRARADRRIRGDRAVAGRQVHAKELVEAPVADECDRARDRDDAARKHEVRARPRRRVRDRRAIARNGIDAQQASVQRIDGEDGTAGLEREAVDRGDRRTRADGVARHHRHRAGDRVDAHDPIEAGLADQQIARGFAHDAQRTGGQRSELHPVAGREVHSEDAVLCALIGDERRSRGLDGQVDREVVGWSGPGEDGAVARVGIDAQQLFCVDVGQEESSPGLAGNPDRLADRGAGADAAARDDRAVAGLDVDREHQVRVPLGSEQVRLEAIGDEGIGRSRRELGSIADAVAVRVGELRLGAGAELGQVVEAVAVGVAGRVRGGRRVEAVAHLEAVAEPVAVAVGEGQVRSEGGLLHVREPVAVAVLEQRRWVARELRARDARRRLLFAVAPQRHVDRSAGLAAPDREPGLELVESPVADQTDLARWKHDGGQLRLDLRLRERAVPDAHLVEGAIEPLVVGRGEGVVPLAPADLQLVLGGVRVLDHAVAGAGEDQRAIQIELDGLGLRRSVVVAERHV